MMGPPCLLDGRSQAPLWQIPSYTLHTSRAMSPSCSGNSWPAESCFCIVERPRQLTTFSVPLYIILVWSLVVAGSCSCSSWQRGWDGGAVDVMHLIGTYIPSFQWNGEKRQGWNTSGPPSIVWQRDPLV